MSRGTHLTHTSSNKDWLLAVLSDTPTFSRSKKALSPLISKGASRITFSDKRSETEFKRYLEQLVQLAATLFIKNIWRNRKQKFSTYYTWFMAEAVNTYDADSRSISSSVLAKYGDGSSLAITRMPTPS